MGLTKFLLSVLNVQALNDRPNSNSGLSADQVKAVFDKAGTDLKTYINSTLIPELDSNSGFNIGIFNVFSYGATGLGITSDTVACQTAIDAVSAAGGGIVYFPKGTYLLSCSALGQWCLNVPSNVYLVGAGRDITTLKLANNQAQWTRIVSVIARTNVQILNLGFDGNRANNLSGNEHMHCIFVYDSTNVKILNCKMNNAVGDGLSLSGSIITSVEIEVDGCHIENNKRSGIVVESAQRIKITKNNVLMPTGSGSALDFEPFAAIALSDAYISGNTFTHADNTATIISFGGQSQTLFYYNIRFIDNRVVGGKITFTWVEDLIFSKNQVDALSLECNSYSKTVSIEGNKLTLSATLGIDIFASFVTAPEGYRIVNNTINTPNGGCIKLRGATGVTISNNRCFGGGTGNFIETAASDRDVTNLIVSDNYVYNFANGLYIRPFSTFYTRGLNVAGNIFDTIATTVLDFYSLAQTVIDLSLGANTIRNSGAATQLSVYSTLVWNYAGVGNEGIFGGTGTPEGVVTAKIGSMYLRRNGGATTTLYVKESGTGNTGWIAK